MDEDRDPAEADNIRNSRSLVPRPADVEKAAYLFGAVPSGMLQRQPSFCLKNGDDLSDVDVRFQLFAFRFGKLATTIAFCQLFHL